ncbi:isopenicillin N synthase family dioxygenase [Halocynthiibacter sp.]|uniref:isopenicillin N synthase family dioxygenase n=1 Tax=Halocynthiibacter sp. TaxID=1979210 RepID=UPI003C57AC6B
MGYAEAKQVESNVIPVVDITALRDGSDPMGVAKALHAANTGLGFIYIKGHGIPEDLIDAVRAGAFDFFRSDEASKEDVRIDASHRGWLPQGGAKMQDDAKADLKESFVWGYQNDAGTLPDAHELRGHNQWPAAMPELQDLCMQYFTAAHGVAEHLMQGFALGLGLDQDFFLRSNDAPLSRNSFVYYPAQDENAGKDQFGVGPHTDFGVLTVLCQDSVGGLQVENIDGEWIQAPPIEGTLIVNVADLLSRWTDGAYKSTPHRVVNSSGKERLSLVLAYDPNPETMIDAKDVFGSDYSPKEDPITCGDYLNWRFARAFAHKKG